MQIAHVSSVHRRTDTRIFLKMCRSAARRGHRVSLVVADGHGDETLDGVEIFDAGASDDRVSRATRTSYRVVRKALSLRPDILHLHDPELIPIALLLRGRKPTRLVFDAHEDIPRQILAKPYLPRWTRPLLGNGFAVLERLLIPRFDAVVTATPTIERRYSEFHDNVLCIANFPLLDELTDATGDSGSTHAVCYVGAINESRGIAQMVDAIALARTRPVLKLGGYFEQTTARARVTNTPGWAQVEELGFLDRSGVRRCLSSSVAGLVTLQPTTAYVDAYPVKLFEYMSAGLPVIASDFPLWREIVEGSDCGICVDPTDPHAIAEAIDTLIENPDMATRMGRNGVRAVETKYRWDRQADKLHDLYSGLTE